MHVRSKALLTILLSLTFQINTARAVEYNPNSLSDLTNGTQLTTFVKWMYYLVTGPKSGDTVGGSTEGFATVINNLLGPDAIGGALWANGVTSCSTIPSSGTIGKADAYEMSYTTPVRTVPSHFAADGGTTYDKAIDVSYKGTQFMTVEMKCNTSVPSIYIRLDSAIIKKTDDDSLKFETYAQKNLSTNEAYLDMFMLNSTKSSKIVSRFKTTDGDSFTVLLGLAESTPKYALVGANGSKKTGMVAVHLVWETTASSTQIESFSTTTGSGVGGSFYGCVDTIKEETGSGCTAISNQGTFDHDGDASTAEVEFTTTNINAMTLRAL